MPPTLPDLLHRYWGFSDFRPLQREAMDAILAGRDSVVVLPTGGGKSLCFQAPALVPPPDARSEGRHGFALVVSPLISLMKDQVDGLQVDGVAAAYLNSTLDAGQREGIVAGLRADRYRLLYVSPERLVGDGSEGFRRLLRDCGVRFIAVDEAHCISQWGHDFRPEYRQLGRIRDDFPGVSLHAFTATATDRVRQDIASELRLRDPLVLVGSFDRPNLTYRVWRRAQVQRQIQQVIARHDREAGIIYCPSRREVTSIATWLQQQGYAARPYHAGLDADVRSRTQEAFLDEEIDIIVATVAFGMGIDRSNVRYVVHAGAPRSPEHYQQESGRAGRDGLAAECVLIYSGSDFVRWRQMLATNGELSDSARALLRDMERYAAQTRCRHRALTEYFGQPYGTGSCDACDWCLKELETVADSTTVARKVLSCVARVRQAWGVTQVTDVLTGRATEKVSAAGHDQLSTFGLLAEHTSTAVRGYIDQLVGHGLLLNDGEPFPVLRLTASGAALLKGEGDVLLYRELAPPKARRGGRLQPARDSAQPPRSGEVDEALFDALRQLRMELARQRGVPPYVIFHDTTLREMAQHRPASMDELFGIYGVGARKAESFGPAFLAVIKKAAECR